jgi:CRISPR-associated protein Csc1
MIVEPITNVASQDSEIDKDETKIDGRNLMRIYLCQLVVHENLYYATREIGRLYETERCLHNYALTYALGLVNAPYFHQQQIPHYLEDLAPLNEKGIYITPARDIDVHFHLNTFKYASNLYHVEMAKGSRNTPSFGRAKEIAVGSRFEFAVFSRDAPLRLPRWVRLGLWRSKVAVSWEEINDLKPRSGTYTAALPLNPLDVPGNLRIFDLISMPPVSLVRNAQIEGGYYPLPDGRQLPADMAYFYTQNES